MEMQREGRVRAILFRAGVVIVAGLLAGEAGRVWLADFWSRSDPAAQWERAARLQPGNAAYWNRLGRFRHWDFTHADLRAAIDHYQQATEIDPRAAGYWMDLASAYEMAGELERAREAFAKARASYPRSTEVSWNYGNFLLRQGRLAEAYTEIRQALKVDPQLGYLAFSMCWRASGETEQILEQALPRENRFYFDAMSFLVLGKELDSALLVWNRALALKQPFSLDRAFPLVEELLLRERAEEARQVWREAVRVARPELAETAGDSLVWDGGFDHEFTNGGLGWRQRPAREATFEFDRATFQSGPRSLRISFDGTTNLDFGHLVQYLPVEPGRKYRFRAYLQTEGISTDSGLRFLIEDPRRPNALRLWTPNLVGSQTWSLQQAEFTTGPQTRLIWIVLRRVPSVKFDNKLLGTVWVDEVSVTPVDRERAGRAP